MNLKRSKEIPFQDDTELSKSFRGTHTHTKEEEKERIRKSDMRL